MKIFRFLFLSLILCSANGFSNENSIHCTPELIPILERIQAFPEGQDVISKVLESGPLYIAINRDLSDEFEGYWSVYERTIYITKNQPLSDCSLVTTLLFELHNALRTADIENMFALVKNHAIGRDEFIENLEYIEYENACNTATLLEQGAQNGFFPCNCGWNLSNNFAEHLRVQQKGGHAASLGRIYDTLF